MQDRVLLAGAEALMVKGLHRATLGDIAERAKLPAGLIDNYFEDMADLIALVLGRGLQYFNQTYIEVGDLQAPCWDRVARLFELAAEKGSQLGPFVNVYFNIGGSGLPDLIKATYDRYEGRAAMFYLNLISTGIKEGSVRNDLDPVVIAYHIHDLTRLMMARRVHALYQARTATYFADYPQTDDGDRRLVRHLIAELKALYAPRGQ
jgi:AcrR family transcriptional regulator